MTSSCVSPARFHGLPWESWTNSLGRTSPIADKPPETKKPERNKAGVMKLPKEDMKIFGLCPERDPFTVVVCGMCNICVKPQALYGHFEMRHISLDKHPRLTTTDIVVPEKTNTKVVKSILKNPTTKVKTKKTSSKEASRVKEGIVNTTPSLPVSLTLEAPNADSGTSKGEPLQPIVALTPLTNAPAASVISKACAPPPPAVIPVLNKPRRPPRKHAPIKEREYDPDKHCGVVSAETMKPCTWSLTCKAHPMSLRRAVIGRSKPFDQLLTDHRQAKEALLKQKKNLEQHHNSSVVIPSVVHHTNSYKEQKTHPPPEKPLVVEPITTLLLRLPELSLDVTPAKRIYLSSTPKSLRVDGSERLAPPLLPTSTQLDVVALTLNHPKALNVSPMFSNHKIGGLVYTNRRMQIARRALETCINRAGSGLFLAHKREMYSSLPISSMPSTLSNVLNNMSSRAAFQKNKTNKRSKQDKPNKPNKSNKPNKPNKPNKKMCLSKEATNLINIQINNLKSVLSRQYPHTSNRLTVPSTTNTQFHIPNILSNALKRSTETPQKTQNKKLKKKNSPIVGSVLSNHSKNGLTPNKSSMPYVRVAIANGKVESDSKTLGLCETPKFTNSNKILNETDLRNIGLRFEIFE